MYFEKWELRQLCINEGTYNYMPFISRYLSLPINEKLKLWEEITIHNLLKSSFNPEDEKWYQKLWRSINNNLPWIIHKQKWFDAFMFFYEWEEKQIESINFRRGKLKDDECK